MSVKEIVKVTKKTLMESFEKVGDRFYRNKNGILYEKVEEAEGICQLERL